MTVVGGALFAGLTRGSGVPGFIPGTAWMRGEVGGGGRLRVGDRPDGALAWMVWSGDGTGGRQDRVDPPAPGEVCREAADAFIHAESHSDAAWWMVWNGIARR